MDMTVVKGILIILAVTVLPAGYFIFLCVTLLLTSAEKNRPVKPDVFKPDEHIYYPFEFSRKMKVMSTICMFSLLGIALPVLAFAVGWAVSPKAAFIAAGITFAVGLLITIIFAVSPFSSGIECLVLTPHTLTLKYKKEEEPDKVYYMDRYEHCILPSRNQIFRAVFSNMDSDKNEDVYLNFITNKDIPILIQDLETVKKSCRLPLRQNAQPTGKPAKAAAAPAPSIQPAGDAAAKQKQLVEDKTKYPLYLENVLAKIPYNKRDEFIRRFLKGDKAETMRDLQRFTREGLRIVADLAANYLIFPDMHDYTSRIFIAGVSRSAVEDSLREYGEIYTDPFTGNTSVSEVPGTDWLCVTMSPAYKDADSFRFDEFLNVLLWLSPVSKKIFAYAVPNGRNTGPSDNSALASVGAWAGTTPFYAVPDFSDGSGESCTGILNGRLFRFVVPDLTLSYGKDAPENLKSYILKIHEVVV